MFFHRVQVVDKVVRWGELESEEEESEEEEEEEEVREAVREAVTGV